MVTNYSAAKAGVASATVVWAKELARYLRGRRGARLHRDRDGRQHEAQPWKMTSGIPLKRMGKPAEIAHSVAYIFENDYYTGRILELDGGGVSDRGVRAKEERQPDGRLLIYAHRIDKAYCAHAETDAVAGLVEIVVGTADDVLLPSCSAKPVGHLVTQADLGIERVIGHVLQRLAEFAGTEQLEGLAHRVAVVVPLHRRRRSSPFAVGKLVVATVDQPCQEKAPSSLSQNW